MTRASFLVLIVGAASLVNARARAGVEVAPPPREIRPDGTRDPVPQPAPPAKGENPAATVERIIKNSKDVGDKLAKTDTGTDTRKTQGKILSDIDALINQQENPPPQPDKDKDKDKDKSDKKDPMNPDMGPKNGTDNTGMPPMPMNGMGEQPMGRKPRMNDTKTGPGSGGGDTQQPGKADNAPKKTGEQPKDPAGSPGGTPMGKGSGRPALPFEDDVAKDVWGHLPDKLRQQMSQYYKEDFTPKYAELLRLYYSSLSDKAARPGDPKK